jgi:hypothetical protein
MKYVEDTGNLTAQANMYNDDLSQTLNIAINLLNQILTTNIASDGTVTNNGIVSVNKTTAEISALLADTETVPKVGTIFFDTDIAKLKVVTSAGTAETITSS